MLDQTTLFSLLEDALKYTPVVYNQARYYGTIDTFDNVYEIEYKYTDLPADGLLFFMPSVSAVEGYPCKLKIKKNGAIETYDILVETVEGITRSAERGDILAHRLCFFRTQLRKKAVILCNSPLFHDATYKEITVRDCKIVNSLTVEGETVVTQKEYNKLLERVEKLERKFTYGKEEPAQALEGKEVGSIYIQIGE